MRGVGGHGTRWEAWWYGSRGPMGFTRELSRGQQLLSLVLVPSSDSCSLTLLPLVLSLHRMGLGSLGVLTRAW